jgi:hypothetical protein
MSKTIEAPAAPATVAYLYENGSGPLVFFEPLHRASVQHKELITRADHDKIVNSLLDKLRQESRFGEGMLELASTNKSRAEELQKLQPSPFKIVGEHFTLDDAGILMEALEGDGIAPVDADDPETQQMLFDRITPVLERHQLEVQGVPLDDQSSWIMGLPNFTCAGYAQQLRAIGHTINRKSEDEQAHVIHWMLGIYFKHGRDKWRNVAQSILAGPRITPAVAANDESQKAVSNG